MNFVSQEYNDSGSWELTEYRVALPLALASIMIGIRIVENILSKSPWTISRGFHLFIASAFLMLVPFAWRGTRKLLTAFDALCSENSESQIHPAVSRRLRKLIKELVSLSSSVFMLMLVAFYESMKL